MSRPYQIFGGTRPGRPSPISRRRGSVGTMACQCRRRRAPPQCRRPRILRRRLARDRGAQPLAQPRALRRQRRRVDLSQAFRARRGTRGQAPFRDVRRRVLPGRRVARRRVPRRSGGLLLPPHVRHHQPVSPGHRTCPRRRGGLPASTEPQDEAHHHRCVPELGRDGSDLEPRWSVAAGADRNHGASSNRPVARAVPRRQRHPRPPAVARPARQRCGAHRACSHPDRRRATRPARAIAGGRPQRSRLEPRHRRSTAVVAVDPRRPGVDRRRGRDLGRRCDQRHPQPYAPGSAR